ncbi:hypothetical protein [Celeribacter arenosi]|uniref:Asparagine synthetase domain-containing protein n=1 Tax=Celeribacter arenosi TaxID=792649 RepID=A0ABP7KDD9_9RHOB
MRGTVAEEQCDAHGFDFAETFRNQYHIAPLDVPPPEGFESVIIFDWRVSFCPSLHTCLVTDANGVQCGVILGHAVAEDGTYLSGTTPLDGGVDTPSFFDAAEAFIKWAAGRFMAFFATPTDARAYPDPVSSFGFVYDPETKCVASSLFLSLHRPLEENPAFDNAAIVKGADCFGTQTTTDVYKGSYGFGMTRDRHVRRSVANHYLDLASLEMHRFWPKEGDFDRFDLPRRDLADLIVERLKTNVRALVAHNDTGFLLSGGYDSKMVLAAAQSDLAASDRLKSYVFASTWNQTIDVNIAAALGESAGLQVTSVVPEDGHKGSFLQNKKEFRRKGLQYVIATGSIGRMPNTENRGYLDRLPEGGILITGNMLEICSAVWWPAKKIDDAEHAVIRCQVARNTPAEIEDREARFASWFEKLPDAAKLMLHDFNYMENTLPNTQSAYLGFTRQFRVPPANDRAIFAASMCTAVPWRRRRGLFWAIVARSSPDLHKLPTVEDIKFVAKRDSEATIEELAQGDLEAVKQKFVQLRGGRV